MIAVGLHLGKERGIGVELAGQLVGIAPVDVGFHVVVPARGLVAVERIAARDVDAGQGGLLLQGFGDGLQVIDIALSPAVVGLVEGRQRHHLVAGVLVNPFHRGHNQFHPVVHDGPVVQHIVGVDARLLVFVEHHVHVGAYQIGHLVALLQHRGLVGGERLIVDERLRGLETASHQREVRFADVVDTLAHVLFAQPRHVHTPSHGQALARGGLRMEREMEVGLRRCFKIHTGRKPRLLLGP